jgi:hypothetical protein
MASGTTFFHVRSESTIRRVPGVRFRSMDDLIKKIQGGIDEKKFSSLFRKDVETIVGGEVGIDPKARKAIEDFAKSHGWIAKISEAGPRVTFWKVGNNTRARA